VYKCRFCEEGKKILAEEDYKAISSIGKPSRSGKRELNSNRGSVNRDDSVSRSRNHLHTPTNSSILDSKDLRRFNDNISSLNTDIIKDYKDKVERLQSDLNNRDH